MLRNYSKQLRTLAMTCPAMASSCATELPVDLGGFCSTDLSRYHWTNFGRCRCVVLLHCKDDNRVACLRGHDDFVANNRHGSLPNALHEARAGLFHTQPRICGLAA